MPNTLDDDRHAILSIAVKPRETIRYVLTTKSLPYFIFVGVVGMFAGNLMSFIGQKFPGRFTLGDIVYSSFISSFLLYFFSTSIMAGILMLSRRSFPARDTAILKRPWARLLLPSLSRCKNAIMSLIFL